jgi:hypothetical protein
MEKGNGAVVARVVREDFHVLAAFKVGHWSDLLLGLFLLTLRLCLALNFAHSASRT